MEVLDSVCRNWSNHPYAHGILVQFGWVSGRESHSRSIAKAVSYRILGSATTGLIVYVVTGKGSLSIGVGAADIVLKIGVYFIHERIWDRINYGRETKAPEYEI
jgi:uncharacterized membrane protein